MSWYKAYPEYKDSGVEWLGKIPKSWELERIKEIAKLINGYPFDSKLFEPSQGMPLVRIRDIYSKKTEINYIGYIPSEALIDNGDVLISMDGDFNVAIWKGGKAALNQRVACIRSGEAHSNQMIQLLSDSQKAEKFAKVLFDLLKLAKAKSLDKTQTQRL